MNFPIIYVLLPIKFVAHLCSHMKVSSNHFLRLLAYSVVEVVTSEGDLPYMRSIGICTWRPNIRRKVCTQ